MKTTMTTNRIARFSVRALVASSVGLLLLASAPGCSHDSADLRLTSLQNKANFRQQFTKAYYSKGEDGDTEIVLLSDAADSSDGSPRVAKAGGAIDSSASVRQVMHLRVLWRPSPGTKQSHPSYTNAGIHWYVLGGSATTDVLEYTGAGFVSLSDSPLGTQVTIKNATLKPVENPRCKLNDPVGQSRLTGTFFATRSAKRVSDVLAEVQSAAQLARSAEQASAQ